MKKSIYYLFIAATLFSCAKPVKEEINIGVIVPLTTRATDLGIGPANAMQLAVDEYNVGRSNDEPKVNIYIEDDEWDGGKDIVKYNELRSQHKIDVLFISNSDGMISLKEQIKEDKVLMVNPLNSAETLSDLGKNTFKIAKKTEEANGLIGLRILELGLKNVLIFQYPNAFMKNAGSSVQKILDQGNVKNKLVVIEKDQIDFSKDLEWAKENGVDAIVFFGYKNLGFGMKQARELGLTSKFFGSTVLLDPEYYTNSEGTLVGTEFCFFTEVDGNYFLAEKFLTNYEKKYSGKPKSVWSPMQAYDAMNIVLRELRTVNSREDDTEELADWLSHKLKRVRKYQGVCGNISITEDGSSRGIYFSLYEIVSDSSIEKVKTQLD